MENEFWTVVIDSSANLIIMGAAVTQTVIFYVTLKLASDKIREIEKQTKISNRENYKRDSIFNLHLFKKKIFYGFVSQKLDFNEYYLEKYKAVKLKDKIYGEENISKIKFAIEVTWFLVAKKEEYMDPLISLTSTLTLLDENFFRENFDSLGATIKDMIVEFSSVDSLADDIIREDYFIELDKLGEELNKIPSSHADSDHPMLRKYFEKCEELEKLILSYN